ncbi:hypothetical protein ACWD00_38945 [Streptomyces viridiviolaceus]
MSTGPRQLVHHWHTPVGEYGTEWHRATEVQKAIDAFRKRATT